MKPSLKFRIPIFGIKIKVYQTNDLHQLAEKLGTTLNGPALAWEDMIDDNVILAFDENHDYRLILGHESGHAAWDVMELIGMDVNRETEEVLFYLQDYIHNYIAEYL